MPIVLKSGSLTLLDPSGAAQACNGFALSIFTVHGGHSILLLTVSSFTWSLFLLKIFLFVPKQWPLIEFLCVVISTVCFGESVKFSDNGELMLNSVILFPV